MIKLEVEDYCHDCPGFKATSVTNVVHTDDYSRKTVITVVQCVNHKQCAAIKRYLEREQNNGKNQ